MRRKMLRNPTGALLSDWEMLACWGCSLDLLGMKEVLGLLLVGGREWTK